MKTVEKPRFNQIELSIDYLLTLSLTVLFLYTNREEKKYELAFSSPRAHPPISTRKDCQQPAHTQVPDARLGTDTLWCHSLGDCLPPRGQAPLQPGLGPWTVTKARWTFCHEPHIQFRTSVGWSWAALSRNNNLMRPKISYLARYKNGTPFLTTDCMPDTRVSSKQNQQKFLIPGSIPAGSRRVCQVKVSVKGKMTEGSQGRPHWG